MNVDKCNELLIRYIQDPENPESNYALGIFYEDNGHTASAVSYYLRTAERTYDTLLQYECLLRAAICFKKQGCRNYTVKGLMQNAISLDPKRPEAYFLLSKHYEHTKEWSESYMIASIGDKLAKFGQKPLRTWVEYPFGDYGILFQKAVASWWCGLCDESRKLFVLLKDKYQMEQQYEEAVNNNLQKLYP
jgi:tetratricopeptide (TPR) repeat protein